MEQILVELWIPAAEQKYDIWIPKTRKLYQVTQLISAAVADLCQGQYCPTGNALLCNQNGVILDVNMSAEELSLENGSQLMLI